jgi:gluconate 5-dehydrogenase
MAGKPRTCPDALRPKLLDPAIMGPPVVWLASPEAAGVHEECAPSDED